jgi:hypothetical protein
MVEGRDGRWERDKIPAASAAYLNNRLEQTAHSARFWVRSEPFPVGRCSSPALGFMKGGTPQEKTRIFFAGASQAPINDQEELMIRQRVFLKLLGLLLILLLSTAATASRRTALIIGNAAYVQGPLRNPVNDATAMATSLRQLGFAVALLRNVDLRTMQEAVTTFSQQLRQGGTGLFYYAGHGVQVHGENYLIPLSASIDRVQDVPYEALPVGRILGAMEDAANQTNILILDACRNNPFTRAWRSYQRGLAVVQAIRGSLIAYATAPGEVAYDGDGKNGLYTSHLLQHLATPNLSVEGVFKRVRAGVVNDTEGQQVPWESSSLIGHFSFVPPAIAGASTTGGGLSSSQPASGPSPVRVDLEAKMWAMVEASAYPADVQMYLGSVHK